MEITLKKKVIQMKIHEIPYVPREIPVDTKQEHKGTFEEELRKQMRGQVVTNVYR